MYILYCIVKLINTQLNGKCMLHYRTRTGSEGLCVLVQVESGSKAYTFRWYPPFNLATSLLLEAHNCV